MNTLYDPIVSLRIAYIYMNLGKAKKLLNRMKFIIPNKGRVKQMYTYIFKWELNYSFFWQVFPIKS